MTPKLFSELGLSPEMLKAIDRLGFEQASPIQAEAIPPMLAGRDIVGQSQTGSGKTAAFAIPLIERIDPHQRAVQALILCPTRELAVQVAEEVHKLAIFKRGIHALPIYGGQSYERQFQGLRQGVQLVIGTPGRVMDHMRRGTLRLETARMVVLDEADVMLDMGFREDIEFILQGVPPTRQTVFFSATMPSAIQDLIQRFSREPQNVRIQQKTATVSTVEQVYYEVDRRFKIELLTRLIDIHDLRLGIVFCNTKRMVDDLVDHLEAQGYSADRLHGDMTQAMRDRVMNKFRKSGLEFLVATDVAARGIDVDDVQVVFNYDLPYDPEDYVHRIGRTGRAGRSGKAVSFVSGREVFQIRHIERFTNMRIQRGRIPTVAEVEEARADVFIEKLRATLRSGEFKRQDHMVERLLEEGFDSVDIASALLHHLKGGESQSPASPPRDGDRSAPRGAVPSGPAEPAPRPRSMAPDPGTRSIRPPQPARRGAHESMPSNRPVVPSGVEEKGAGGREQKAAPVASSPASAAGTGEKPAAEPAPGPTGRVETSVRPIPASAPIATDAEVLPVTPRETVVAASAPSPAPHVRKHAAAVPVPPVKVAPGPRVPLAPGAPSAVKLVKVAKAPPAAPQPPRQIGAPQAPSAPAKKPSRATPGDQTRLYINIGTEMGVVAGDIVSMILGQTGLPAKVVGVVDVRERHLFVDVAAEHANAVVAKLNRAYLKDRRLKAKVA